MTWKQRFYKWFSTMDFLYLWFAFSALGLVLIYLSLLKYYAIDDAMIQEAVHNTYSIPLMLVGLVALVCMYLSLVQFVNEYQIKKIIKENGIAVIE